MARGGPLLLFENFEFVAAKDIYPSRTELVTNSKSHHYIF